MTSGKAIIDSGVWIGARYKNDQYREKALAIVEAFLNRKIKEVHLTDYVLAETINFLLRKEGYETASEALNSFLESERVSIRHVDKMKIPTTASGGVSVMSVEIFKVMIPHPSTKNPIAASSGGIITNDAHENHGDDAKV